MSSDMKKNTSLNQEPVDKYPTRSEILDFVKANAKNIEPKREKKVSIIILNRDGLDHLKRCFEGIRKHTLYPNYEIIVVDNASKDESVDYLEGLQMSNLRIIKNNKNKSFSEANNQGTKRAGGEYLLFLNNDTEPLYNYLNEMLHVAEADDKVGIVGSKLIYPDCSIQHMGIAFFDEGNFIRPLNQGKGLNPLQSEANILKEVPAVTAAAMLIRRELFIEVGGFDEGYFYGYEDVDICLKVAEIGYKVFYCPTSTLIHHEFATTSKRTNAAVERSRENNMKLFSDKWDSKLREKLLRDQLLSRSFYTTKKLKIGFIVTEDIPDTAAGDYYTASGLGKELSGLGYEVTLIATKGAKRGYDVPMDVDILIVLLDSYDIGKIDSNVSAWDAVWYTVTKRRKFYKTFSKRKLLKVAWIRNWLERWTDSDWFDDFDLILTSSEPSRRIIKEKTGRDSELFMIGVDDGIFKQVPSEKKYRCDLVFTGNYWGCEREIVGALDIREDWDVSIYGKNWEKIEKFKKYWKGFISYYELPKVYSSAKIVIDDHNHVTKPYGMINSRVFESMACAACVITNDVKDIDKVFSGAVAVYHSKEELEGLIDYYLKNEDERIKMGERAREIVLRDHTYKTRAKEFKEIVLRALESGSI